MRKHSKVLVLLFGFVLVLALTGMAQQSDETVTCATTGETMKKSEAKATYEYNGKMYYFCCDGCKEAFVKNPAKYIQKVMAEEHMHQHGEATEEHMHTHGEEDGTVVDPVCGMKIKKSDAKATTEYNGKTYYFCMEDCLEKFKKDPAKYAQKAEEMVTCPVSGKTIRKSEASGSHQYNGKTYYFCCANCKEKFLENPEKYAKKKGETKSPQQGSCATCELKKIK
jgi:YHS domain-containing protein